MKAATKDLLIACVSFFSAALLSTPSAAQKVGTEGKPLTIATGRFHGFLPAYRVAADLKAQGIATKIIEFPSATERLEAVAAGYAHMSYAGLTASVILRARGKDVVVVASTNEKGRGLVSKQDIADVKGLKGKKIGVTFGSIEQMTLIGVLRQNGLDSTKDVTLVNMPATDQPIALSKGSIDAYMGFEPWAVFGVKKFGGKVLSYPYETSLGAIDSGVETNETFIKEYPHLVKALVASHVKAVKYYRENPAEVVKSGVENYKVPEDIMQDSMKNVELTYAIKPDEIKALAQFMVEVGILKKEEQEQIDWSKFINTSFVDAAK
jgi:ABC-type nitrate/sulfonate/bicarbonate transport system substrate-binding protein